MITSDELKEIKRLFSEFIIHYEKEYYQRESARLPAALISFHYLLHVAKSIQNTGPAWATWQYPMERLCGMLLPLVRSRQYPYTNLTNQITVWNQFSHLQYFPDINERVFGSLTDTKKSEEDQYFKLEDRDEMLVPLMQKHTIDQKKKRLLRNYYATAQETEHTNLEVCLFIIYSSICSLSIILIFHK